MPLRQTGRKVYKSMQGKTIDMDLLRQKNELTPAVGNARVNARGDELGPGGNIIKKKEDLLKEYYSNNPGAPDEVESKRPRPTDFVDEQDIDNWVEDEDGNFVQKED